MRIYVSGPYSPTPEESASGHGATAIDRNIETANTIAMELAKKGHYPFVPHTMLRGWEDVYNLPRELALTICYQWVRKCDALYFIGSSSGAEHERMLATELSLPIYRDINDVPTASDYKKSGLSQAALEAYLAEYKECAECYRHTYSTIYQSGGLLATASGALMAFASSPIIQSISLLPILFWYIGIFIPMNSYAEHRSTRLKNIEEELNRSIGDLTMRHFSLYDQERKKKLGLVKRLGAHWRVSQVMNVLFFILLTIQVLLFMLKGWPSIKSLILPLLP